MPRTLRYRGLEAWLEDTQGRSIPLYNNISVDDQFHRICARAYLEPKTSFTLHWRRETGLEPMSAFCQVFLQNGYFLVHSSDFCVATNVMDRTRKVTQTRSTYSHMNPPYKKHGCLKAGRDCDFSAKYPKPFSMPSGSCKLRLEIRRINEEAESPQWVAKTDSNTVATVINFNNLDIIDDAKKGLLPYAEFVIEIPDITLQAQRRIGTSHLKSSTKEPVSSESQLQMTLRPRREDRSAPSVTSSQSALQHVGNSDAHEKNKSLPAAAASENGTVIHCPRKAPEIKTAESSEQPQDGQTRVEQWLATTTSVVTAPDVIDVDELESVQDPEEDTKTENKSIITLPTGFIESALANCKRKDRDWDEVKVFDSANLKLEAAEDDVKASDLSVDVMESYQAVDKLEKELTKKLEEKMKVKKKKIKKLQRLLALD